MSLLHTRSLIKQEPGKDGASFAIAAVYRATCRDTNVALINFSSTVCER